jgi:hypothetical protein
MEEDRLMMNVLDKVVVIVQLTRGLLLMMDFSLAIVGID